MKKLFYCALGVLVLCVINSGCASIMTGTKHSINVQCEPEDSKILINGAVHKSPCSQDIERGIYATKKNKVVAEKEGYKTCEFNPSGNLHPWFLGNIILGGLIGMAIDMGTGAVSSVEEKDIKMVLYEQRPCDVYIRMRFGRADDKWIKYGEKEASPSKEEKSQPKDDWFKNVQTGAPQTAK